MRKIVCNRWLAAALLAGVSLSLLWGMWSLHRQQMLADEVIRLHVIAASDSAADQRLKLRVRDAVLEKAASVLAEADSREEAEKCLRRHLPALRDAAADTVEAAGCTDSVQALLSVEPYPTRDYGTFALPGGEYLSLRVVIGEGAGHNWWCVVYPPLCTAVVTEDMEQRARQAGLSEEDISIITRADELYTLKFKSIELWENWTTGWKKGDPKGK